MLIILSIVLIIVGLFLGILIGTLGSFCDSEIPIKEDKIIKRCLLFNIASRCDKIILVCCTPFGWLGILLLFVCCFVFQHIIGIMFISSLPMMEFLNIFEDKIYSLALLYLVPMFGGYFIGYNYMNNFIKRIEKEEHEERN